MDSKEKTAGSNKDNKKSVKRIRTLIISVAGIGSTLLATPLIENLKKTLDHQNIPNTIDILVAQKGSQDLLQHNPSINNIFIINKRIKKNFFNNLKTIKHLRKKRYDYSILAFPANRLEFNLLSYFIHAKKRIAHSYPKKKLISLNFLNQLKIPQQQTFDIIQNNNLLVFFDQYKKSKQDNQSVEQIKLSTKTKIFLTEEEKKFAQEYIKKNMSFNSNQKNQKIIGFHLGCSPDQPYKRWPLEKYTKLMRLLQKSNYQLILFAGPSEIKEAQQVQKHLKNIILVNQPNIRYIAALLEKCHYLITNDSSIMHIGVALSKKVLSIYGASDPRRTAPYHNFNNIIRKGLSCQPCDRTLNNLGQRFHCIYQHFKCLTTLSVEEVYQKFNQWKNQK